MMKKSILNIQKKAIIEQFDEEYYRENISDSDLKGMDPLEHYITIGWKIGLNPSPDFSVNEYIKDKPNFIVLDIEPLYYMLRKNRLAEPDYVFHHMGGYGDSNNLLKIKEIVASYFDIAFYLIQIPSVSNLKQDPVEHYVEIGWKDLIDPNPEFSVSIYLENNPEVKAKGIEPFYHWITNGRKEGIKSYYSLYPAKKYTTAEIQVLKYFDFPYYLNTYPDVKEIKHNPLIHYMRGGWREGRNPNKNFKTSVYILNNLDLITSGQNPFQHYVLSENAIALDEDEVSVVKKLLGYKVYHAYQDITFPQKVEHTSKLAVFILPEHNEMSGGIFSIFSIINVLRRMKLNHGYDVILMTRPNKGNYTYCRQRHFINSEDVYRFEQITRCRSLKDLYIHIPEYATVNFVSDLANNVKDHLSSVPNVYINILNQNTELMPDAVYFEDLRLFSTKPLSQSVAHHAYFGQEYADKYNLQTLLLPAYTDLSAYAPTSFKDKEKIIIYSSDNAPHKRATIDKIKNHFNEYKLIEIHNFTFDEYMDLATRCMFSISFGEGFDGYVAQPIYMGGIGMALYKKEFFPSDIFIGYDIFFKSEEDMIDNICSVMDAYIENPSMYNSLNRELLVEYNKLYCFNEYVEKITKLIHRDFDIHPGSIDVKRINLGFRSVDASSGINL